LQDGGRAVVLFNRQYTGLATSISISWAAVGWEEGRQVRGAAPGSLGHLATWSRCPAAARPAFDPGSR
jgi:hypothetical protein